MPNPHQPPRARIQLPWIEPLVCPIGHTMPEHGIIAYKPPVGSPAELACTMIPIGATKAVWARAVPELLTCPDAVSVALALCTDAGSSQQTLRPVPVRLHEIHELLRTPPPSTATRIHNSLYPYHVPLRIHHDVPRNADIPVELEDFNRVGYVRAGRYDVPVETTGTTIHRHDLRRLAHHWCKPSQIFWPKHRSSPSPGTTYIGFEFEASFPINGTVPECNILAAMFQASDQLNDSASYDGVDGARRPAAWYPRLHVETDSTVPNGYEIVTMPHALGDPSTHEAMRHIFGTLMRLGANNRTGRCGMHMHMSKSILDNHPNRTPTMDDAWVENVVHRFSALVLKHAERAPAHHAFLTGRPSGPSNYAAATLTRTASRYLHINWANTHTLEFRWPGPGNFKSADWPNVVADICFAMVEAATRVMRHHMNSDGSIHARVVGARGYRPPPPPLSAAHHEHWAMTSLQRMIANDPDVYPYAYRHFFQNHGVPAGFILI